MAITHYSLTLRIEYLTKEDRDKAYDDLKTSVNSAKALTTPSFAQIQKDEYVKPDMSSELLV